MKIQLSELAKVSDKVNKLANFSNNKVTNTVAYSVDSKFAPSASKTNSDLNKLKDTLFGIKS